MKKPKISRADVGFIAGAIWPAIYKFIYYESPVSNNTIARLIFSILACAIMLIASNNLAEEISDN